MDTEIWKVIKNFPDYMVSSHGRVQSFKRKNPIILKESTDQCGYKHVRLTNDLGCYIKTIHRLVCETFHENPEGHPMVLHGDHDPSNNHYLNLRWGTHQDNMDDRKVSGRENHQSRYNITWILVSPQGVTTPIDNLKSFCESNNLDQGGMHKVVRGQRKSHKGWTCQVSQLVV